MDFLFVKCRTTFVTPTNNASPSTKQPSSTASNSNPSDAAGASCDASAGGAKPKTTPSKDDRFSCPICQVVYANVDLLVKHVQICMRDI